MNPSALPSASRWCFGLVFATLIGASACSLFDTDDVGVDTNDDACFEGWVEPEDLGIPVLGMVVQIDGGGGDYVALTDAGRVIQYQGTSSSLSEQIGDVGITEGLRSYAVAPQTRFAAGDGGQIWRGALAANEWEPLDPGLTDDSFHTILASSDGAWVMVASDSEAFGSMDLGDSWDDLNRPVGLRKGFWVGETFWFVGDLGQVWFGTEPNAWTEVPTPTTDSLIGGGPVPGCTGCVIVHSSSTLYFFEPGGEWIEIVAQFDADIVAYDRLRVATIEGTVFDIGVPGSWSATEVATVEYTPTVLGGDTDEVQIAGTDAELQVTYYVDGC